MKEDEFNLWERNGQRDETAQRELILFYLPLVDVLAKRIARSTGTTWEDLRQDGAIGLIKAITRFDPSQGVPFKAFAKHYICGAIFDSSEITRDMPRRQEEIYRKLRQTEAGLTQTLGRNPTIEEVAEKAGLTIEQIRNAIDARGVAFAEAMPDTEDSTPSSGVQTVSQERAVMVHDALSRLNKGDQEVIRFYYWEDLPDREIAERLGLTLSNITKIRQRAINKLRKHLDAGRKGGHDDRRAGK
jgi:RNA polymerase sigma factor (sigma-70 family)